MTLTTQVEATNVVVRKLEEKERILQNALATAEKELSVRQQAMEMHKRKAIESAQSAADLKLHLEKYHAQMKEAQQVVAEKTSALEAEAYKTRRLQVSQATIIWNINKFVFKNCPIGKTFSFRIQRIITNVALLRKIQNLYVVLIFQNDGGAHRRLLSFLQFVAKKFLHRAPMQER